MLALIGDIFLYSIVVVFLLEKRHLGDILQSVISNITLCYNVKYFHLTFFYHLVFNNVPIFHLEWIPVKCSKSVIIQTTLHCSPKLREPNLTDVLPVQQYASLLQFHHTKQRQEQSRLPWASASNDPDPLTWHHQKTDAIQSIGQSRPIRQDRCVKLYSTVLGPGSWKLVKKLHS